MSRSTGARRGLSRLLRRRVREEGARADRADHSWELGPELGAEDRKRLESAGVPDAVLDELDVREVTGPLPRWWTANGNALYLPAGLPVAPGLVASATRNRVADALVVLASDLSRIAYLSLGGDGATVFVGPASWMPGAEIHCGAGSEIILCRQVTCTARPSIDARNGGSIFAGPDQLWASDVIISTDDMHRIEDLETGERLNAFGAHIRIAPHVWLGRGAALIGNVEIGANTVLGMRGLVAGGSLPGNCVAVGAPARVVRQGTTWTREDTAPDLVRPAQEAGHSLEQSAASPV